MDRGQVTGDTWQVTPYMWHRTPDTWHMTHEKRIFCIHLLSLFDGFCPIWYLSYYLHMPTDFVYPVCMIFSTDSYFTTLYHQYFFLVTTHYNYSRQTWKIHIHEPCRVQLFKRFSAKFVNISAKFGFLNMRTRNNFKNVILVACKWCKIFKYSVNRMLISYIYCQKEEKECILVKYLICAMSQFQICRNSHVFSAKSETQNFRVHKKMFFFQVWLQVKLKHKPQICLYWLMGEVKITSLAPPTTV